MSRRTTDVQPIPEDLLEAVMSLQDEIREARVHLSEIKNYQPVGAQSNATNTNTNHFGSMGVWFTTLICAVCCTAMLTGGAIFAFVTANQVNGQNAKIAEQERQTNEKLARMQDYLNAIYSMAPQLKPKEK